MFSNIRLYAFRYRCLILNIDRERPRYFSKISPLSMKLNSSMKNLISSDQYLQALDLFDRQLPMCTDASYTLALKASARLSDYERGVRIHQQIPSKSLGNPFIQSSLIHFYMQCHRIEDAQRIFSTVQNKTIIMYGAMLKGYLSNDMSEKVIELFEKIPIEVNEVIIVILFKACGQVCNVHSIKLGRDVLHGLPKSYLQHEELINSAINMLMRFGHVEDAEHLFKQMKRKTLVTYGAMMQGYVTNNLFIEGLNFLEQIPLKLDKVLYTIVYNACASLCDERSVTLGKKMFEEMPKRFLREVSLVNSAIHMFMKFGQVEDAEYLFKQVNQPTLRTYGVLINGYKINDQPQKCLILFEQMKKKNIKIGEPIALSLVGACSQIGLRSISENLVNQISHIPHDLQLNNSLIDMWGKSSDMSRAKHIFQSISRPDVFTYNVMINAYGRNGMGYEAIDVYQRMPENIRNTVSHVCVLNACSHSGLIDQARTIYNRVTDKTEKIVTTMIDCLSRLGIFDQAQQLINDYETSNSPSFVMYMAMLSGVRNHRQAALSEKLYNRMKRLFPEEKNRLIAASVLVSNTYSSSGDDRKAEEVRLNRIKQFGKNVKVGLSWTEVNGELVEFQAHDRSHPRSDEIYAELDRLSEELKEHGHEYDSSWIIRPLKEGESIESVLCGHSEKLAIALNLIQQPQPSFMQITKNLRVCGDCHRATKMIAKIRQCEIVVRDANRIHHFHTNGQCSCQDHF